MRSTTTVQPIGRRTRALPRLLTQGPAYAAAVVLALTLLSACANPFAKSSSGHACADKVAAALASAKATPGVWKCVNPTFQNDLHAYGYDGDTAFAGALPAVGTATYIGSTKDMVTYAYTVRNSTGHTETVEVVIWVDPNGLATNLGLATQIF